MMRVSLRWLKEMVPCDRSAPEVAALFTARGLPVEEIVRIGEPFDAAIVVEVVSLQERGVTLFDGKDIVELELPTAQLAVDAKLAYIPAHRHVILESEAGIEGSLVPVILPDKSETGTRVTAWIDDEVLLLEVPPNRADLTGVRGIGRELACYLEQELADDVAELRESDVQIADHFSLEVRDTLDTPDYIARLVSGLRVGPSPFWLKWRLLACGVRPISNVVDITNYILFKYGQPLHGFDYSLLRGRRLVTRRARSDEKIVTLDGVERQLSEKVLVIADAERPVAVAGVMGGQTAEISNRTTDVLIECARFSPAVIRHGSRYLGLSSEASQRFEVGLDTGAMEMASREAAALMQDLAGGTPKAGRLEVRSPAPARRLSLAWPRAAALLGMDLPVATMRGIITRLGFRVAGDGDQVEVEVPTFRPDVETTADLAEEIGRIAGYDSVPSDARYTASEAGRIHRHSARLRRLRSIMQGMGFDEAQTISFTTESLARRLETGGPSLLVKPLNERYAALRPRLLGNLLEALGLNLRRGNQDVRLYEIGTEYRGVSDVQESTELSAVVAGARAPLHWSTATDAVDAFDAAGVARTILNGFGLRQPTIEPAAVGGYAPEASASIRVADRLIGRFGRVEPGLVGEFGIDIPVFAVEIDCDAMWPLVTEGARHVELPRFQSVRRDFAFLVDAGVTAARVIAESRAALGTAVEEAEIFDCFSGSALPAGRRSIGVRLTLRSPDHTLNAGELDEMGGRLVAVLHDRLGAELRK